MNFPETTLMIKGAHELVFRTVVHGELLGRCVSGTREGDNREELQALLRSARVSVAVVHRTTSERYAIIYAYLRHAGKPIPTNCLWIAACAMELGAEVLTADRHFEHLPQVMVRFIGF